MKFGDRLRHLRETNDLEREDIAKILNISYSAISKYETNVRFPDQEILKKIADYFNVSVDYLLGRTDVKDPFQNIDKVSSAVEDDPELKEFWEELQERESLQLMFKQVKNLDDKSIKQVMRIIKAIEDEESRED